MGFKAAFTMNDVKAHMDKAKQGFEDSLLDEFRRTGEQFIADARSIRTYQDQTGNLRNSIGYGITKNGKLIESVFPDDAKSSDDLKKRRGEIMSSTKIRARLARGKGASYGKNLLNNVVKDKMQGKMFGIVVVAGMRYAQYVEAKSYDVLTGSSYAAETKIKARVAKLFEMLNRKK